MGMENIVALYIRISLEDDDIQDGKEESDSVMNQRALLRKYISGHEDFGGASVKDFSPGAPPDAAALSASPFNFTVEPS